MSSGVGGVVAREVDRRGGSWGGGAREDEAPLDMDRVRRRIMAEGSVFDAMRNAQGVSAKRSALSQLCKAVRLA